MQQVSQLQDKTSDLQTSKLGGTQTNSLHPEMLRAIETQEVQEILKNIATNRIPFYRHKKIVYEKLLGKGTLGEVRQGKVSGRPFAFKVIDTLKIMNVFEDIKTLAK